MSKPIYDSRDSNCKQPFGAVATGERVNFTIHLPKYLTVDAASLRIYVIDRWDESIVVPMSFCATDLSTNSYTCSFTSANPALYMYHFEVRSGAQTQPVKRHLANSAVIGDGDLWQLTVYDAAMRTPTCVTEGVMYQIFPDRFYNSGRPKQGVPADRLIHEDWNALPHWQPNENNEVTNSDYFGGDLNGIMQKLDYLQELGVTVLYLNPIFEAHSNHRYNTADYHSVDPLLGTNEDFRLLCKRAAERDISIILDGVFSHTGSDSIYFNKTGRYGEDVGAYRNPESPYVPWYAFRHYPDDYESWWGFITLPNVNETEPSYLDFICGKDGVLHQWMQLGAAGFRLDVADELPDEFLDRLYSSVKAENPDAIIIGEVWEDASNKVSYGLRRRYLLGKQLDSVMNYPFKDGILDYIRNGNGAAFYGVVMQILENYPPPVIPALMNSLSTHDTPRAITVLAGEWLSDQDRGWQEAYHRLTPEQYERGRQLLTLATVLQFGLPGMPCVYYGDEAGLTGYKDPFNRTCYPWGKEDDALLDTIRTLGNIRKKFPIFSEADFLPLMFNDSVCSFVRQRTRICLLFAVNRSNDPQHLLLPRTAKPTLLFSSGAYSDGVLPPLSGVVLQWLD